MPWRKCEPANGVSLTLSEKSPGILVECCLAKIGICRSLVNSTTTSANIVIASSCTARMAFGSANIRQNGFWDRRASMRSVALANIRNLAIISVTLMHVMPKGKTEASPVKKRWQISGWDSTMYTIIAKDRTPPDRKSVTGSGC